MLDSAMISKAKWMADLMLADGVKPERLDDELILAYMDAITRKINSLQAAYLTNANFKKNIQEFVLAAI
jgi:hypothetical protein